MSFFDEQEDTRIDPPAAERPRRQSGSGRRPPSGGRRSTGGRGAPPDEQAIRVRRTVAVVAIVIFVILVVLGVHSCEVSATNSALKDYSDNVASLIQRSNQTGQQFFSLLSSGEGSSNSPNLQSQIAAAHLNAENELGAAKKLNVPDQMQGAQQNLLLALQMRSDGIANIAPQLQSALQTSTATSSLNTIAAEMARFYGSDVVYKDYTLPLIVSALHNAGIAVGGANGEPVQGGQFFPNLQWLTPTFIATQLHVTTPTSNANCSGLHGHALNSVSVGGTMLQTGSPNTIAASPPPQFTLSITNGGNFNESNVGLKVTLSGSSIKGQAVIPQTTAGQTTTGQVTLNGSPPAGNYTLTAEVDPVPCEKDTANNSLTFPVTFQ